MYDAISLALFVNGYMIVIEIEKPAVKPHMDYNLMELMDDSEYEPSVLCGYSNLSRAKSHGRMMAPS